MTYYGICSAEMNESASFCKKCGSLFDVDTGLCSNCDAALETNRPPVKKSRWRYVLFPIVTLSVLTGLI